MHVYGYFFADRFRVLSGFTENLNAIRTIKWNKNNLLESAAILNVKNNGMDTARRQ